MTAFSFVSRLTLVLIALLSPSAPSTPAPPTRDYLVFVAAESADSIHLIRFGPGGIRIEQSRYIGWTPTDLLGPHGVMVSPDGKHYFVSTAHGVPYGSLHKYDAATGRLLGNVMLGMFPATLQISPDGFYAYVANFNFHGDMVPSSISVVATDEMSEITRIETCTMPHGSRLTADGRKHYSTCMMDEVLVEIDTRTMAISRHFMVAAGQEKGMPGPPARTGATHAAHAGGGHRLEPPTLGDKGCQPTWAEPSADGSRIWVVCSKSSEIVEIDGKTWSLVRRIPARPGVYNLDLTSDGTKLLATNKRDQSMSVFDAATGHELARIPTTRPVVSGITVSDDDRYAFVTDEGTASQPGTVDVIDLAALTKVATIDVGLQAGGIDFWRSEPPQP